MGQQLDLREVEARTQAIGQELFTAARREHAHLSVLNRWTAQVLTWCLDDPAVKGAVLRFLDVLPSVRTPADVTRHVREYFPTENLRLPRTLRLGAGLARPGLLTQGALAALIRQLVEQVAHQFIAQQHSEGVAHVVRTLAAAGATCSLDVLGEQVLSEAEADRYLEACQRLVREMAHTYAGGAAPPRSCGPLANLSVKPSALCPRFDPISPQASVEQALGRLRPLLELAAKERAFIYVDMEHFDLRDLTLMLAMQVLERGLAPSGFGVVVQAYVRDAESSVEGLLAWLAAHERTLTVRLVKGAYWDFEVALAQRSHWPSPVFEEKADTDRTFERLTVRLLSAHPLVTTAIASHNVRSIAHAMAVAELLGLSNEQLEFQLLYGMGDALRGAIVARGYPVRIYTPIGELIPGMAYLVRRILENTANESFLRQDLFQERSVEELLAAPEAHATRVTATVAAAAWREEPLANFAATEARDRMRRALQGVRAQMGRRYPLWIGDRARETPRTLTRHNPSRPDEIVGVVAMASLDDAEEAVRIAQEAQPRWAAVPVTERVACLRRAASLIRERRWELAAWSVVEVGKTWREADVEVVEAIEYLEYYGEQMLQLAHGRPLLQPLGERNRALYLPRGVAAVISPWNFPAAILTGMTSAALVTGNAVILKPSGCSSVIAAQIAQTLRDAGLPHGVLQFLPGSGGDVGTALVAHPGVHAILFTGSKSVGLSIIEAAGRVAPGQRFVKHVVTEMGGKNAILIDDDADLDAAVAGSLQSAFGYGGQKCSAASRLIVHEAVSERFLSRFVASADRLVVGDPSDSGTDVGPLIDAAAQQRLREALAHARKAATVAYEYPAARLPKAGYFVGPAVVTDVPRQDRLATEELFGPLICVFRVASFEEALALANDTDYALTGGVYSRSPSHLEQAVRAFDVGNLYLNRPITGAMIGRQPFGGHRLSGLGTKAGGPDYLLHLMIPKTVATNTTRHGMPLE